MRLNYGTKSIINSLGRITSFKQGGGCITWDTSPLIHICENCMRSQAVRFGPCCLFSLYADFTRIWAAASSRSLAFTTTLGNLPIQRPRRNPLSTPLEGIRLPATYGELIRAG